MNKHDKIIESARKIRRLGIEINNEVKEITRLIDSHDNKVLKSDRDKSMAQRVLDAVVGVMGLDEIDVVGKSRKTPLPLARQLTCYVAKSEFDVHETVLASLLDMDRSTVLSHNKKVQENKPYDREMLGNYQMIINELI